MLSKNHWPGLQGKLDNILKQLPENCHCTGDSIEYARNIVNLPEKEAATEAQSPEKIVGTTAQEESQGEDRSNLHDKTEEPDSSPSIEERERERQGGIAPAQKERELSASVGKLHTLIHAKEGELPVSFDEQLASEFKAVQTDMQNSGVRMAVEGKLEVHPLPEQLRQESMAASRALRTRLQALMQARTLRRTVPGRYGRLDGRLLHRLSVRNPEIFLRREEVPGVNTAVHVLMDISGSMRGRMKLASSACYAVASALSGIPGINVGVTVFPALTPDKCSKRISSGSGMVSVSEPILMFPCVGYDTSCRSSVVDCRGDVISQRNQKNPSDYYRRISRQYTKSAGCLAYAAKARN